MNGTYEDAPPPQAEQCTNSLCAHYRWQHQNMTKKCNDMVKELENARRQHDLIYNQVVTRGEALMLRESRAGEEGVRLPNGEILTAEKFLSKTMMMNQCRESLQKSEKKSKQLEEENTKLKVDRDYFYTNMRKFENMLNGFERARNYDVFTDDMHKQALEENARLLEQIRQLSHRSREKVEWRAIKKRKPDQKTKDKVEEEPEEEPEAILKKKHHSKQNKKHMLTSDEDAE